MLGLETVSFFEHGIIDLGTKHKVSNIALRDSATVQSGHLKLMSSRITRYHTSDPLDQATIALCCSARRRGVSSICSAGRYFVGFRTMLSIADLSFLVGVVRKVYTNGSER
jgi:hypothetical protein